MPVLSVATISSAEIVCAVSIHNPDVSLQMSHPFNSFVILSSRHNFAGPFVFPKFSSSGSIARI